MKLKFEEYIPLDEGKHTGEIIAIDHAERPKTGFKYTDILIKVDGEEDRTLKYGCPTGLSSGSKLGKLMAKFIKMEPKEEYDIDQTLLNKKIQFMTMNKETKDGTFTEVIDESIKPIKIPENNPSYSLKFFHFLFFFNSSRISSKTERITLNT